MCTREQRHVAPAPYTFNMQLDSITATVTAVWISAVCSAGIAANVRLLSGWAGLAGLAVLPPLVMRWRLNDPRQSMSEAIQEALR